MRVHIFYSICIGVSLSIVAGVLAGGVKALLVRRTYSQKTIDLVRSITNRLAVILKYTTFVLLAIGFIWCVYFLVLGIVHPEQSDYANSMSELIVSVLTVISILFAFVEFVKKKNDAP